MARRTIVGVLTYSSTANRDAALTRIESALSGYPYDPFTSTVPSGITASGNNINISISIDDRDTAFDAARAIYTAATTTNRQSAGFLSVNRV